MTHHPDCPYGQARLHIPPADCFHCHRLGGQSSTTSGSWAAGHADTTSRSHDPLCRNRYQRWTNPLHCADCDLIHAVRAQYDTPHGSTPWHLGYRQAMTECGCG